MRRLPLRLTTGAFILNAGLGKLDADEERAKGLHSMASGTYPFLADMEPGTFTRLLAVCEITLGSALLLPWVRPRLAGLALSLFAGGLLGMYVKTPGMRLEGSIRPSQQGTAISKDVWLLGVGLSLLLDRSKPSREPR